MTSTTAPAAGGYTPTAKVFHWLVAILVIAVIPGGLVLGSLPEGPIQNTVFDLHRSIGFVILVLMIGRLAWRLKTAPPPSEPTLARWQVGVSHAVHWTLYALLLIMPILGWAGANAFGATVSVFWLFDLPNLMTKDENLAKQILYVHGVLGITVGVLASIHVAAALYHHIRGDAVLARMTTEPVRRPA